MNKFLTTIDTDTRYCMLLFQVTILHVVNVILMLGLLESNLDLVCDRER